jgi:hypothetical protein
VRRARRARLADLQARLTRLRESASWLTGHAAIGRELRSDLAKAGAATWRPAEDLSWRTWVERYGDEYARAFIAVLDELLEERAAGLEVSDEPEEVSLTCTSPAPTCPNRAQSAR